MYIDKYDNVVAVNAIVAPDQVMNTLTFGLPKRLNFEDVKDHEFKPVTIDVLR